MRISLLEGVILPWNKNNQFYKDLILEVSKHCGVNPKIPWKDISKEKKNKIIFGDNKMISSENSLYWLDYNDTIQE